MTTSIPFQTLPTELQCCIIRYLDPIALISLSQTSTTFRKLITPTRTHFLERLLALELDGEIGGPSIKISRFGTVDPDKHSAEWEANRWACAGCLKLLSHYAFRNKGLAGLAYRKPLSGSTNDQQVTSWEPSDGMTRRSRKSLKAIREARSSQEEKKLRERHGRTTSKNWGSERCDWYGLPRPPAVQWARLNDFRECGMESFIKMGTSEFESVSQEQEDEILERERKSIVFSRAGSNRHVRRCNECRFQRGEMRGTISRLRGSGSLKTPIVVGREKWYGTVVDRYFPDVSDILRTKRPPFNAPLYAIYNQSRKERLWTLYRVRCQGCAKWKELRAFRVGGIHPRWCPRDNGRNGSDPYHNWDMACVNQAFLDGMRCNQCYVEEHGRAALGEELVKWLEHLAEKQRGEFAGTLCSGYNSLSYRFRSAPKHLKRKVRGLIWDMRSILDKDSSDMTRSDVVLLRIRREEYMTMGEEIKEWLPRDSSFMKWIDCYDESEALWIWLKEIGEEIREEGKADVLVDWALGRDEIANS
ncbi:hypothetical protein BDW69DRAFT_205197 [Aspergillus filifer]